MPNVTSDSFLQRYAPQASPTTAPPTQTSDDLLANYHPAGLDSTSTGTDLTATPPEYTGWDRPFSLLRNYVVHGVANLLGAPAALGDALAAVDPTRLLPGHREIPNALPTADEIQTAAGRAGLLSREQVTPTGWIERGLAAGTEGLIGTAPLLALGPEGLAAKAGMLAQGAGGSILGEFGKDVTPGSAAGPLLLPLLASGGIGAAAEAGAGREALAAAGAKTTALGTAADQAEAAALAAKARLDDVKARAAASVASATTKTNAPVSGTVAVAKDAAEAHRDAIIDASEVTRDAANKAAQARADATVDSGRSAVDRVARAHGPEDSLETAGRTAQQAAQDWRTNEFPRQQELAWAPVDARIAPNQPVQLDSFRVGLQGLAGDAGKLQATAETLSPGASLAKRLLAGLPADATWADTKTFRSMLGEALGNPQLIRDIPQQKLSELYSRLTDDMRVGAQSGPLDALQQFDAANTQSKNLFRFAEGPLAKLLPEPIGNSGARPGGLAVSSLLATGRKDGSDLLALRQRIPAATDAIAAGALRDPKAPKWSDLAEGAQIALVPSPDHRMDLNIAQLAPEAAKAHVADVKAAADQAHRETVAAARTDAKAASDRATVEGQNYLTNFRAGREMGVGLADQAADRAKAAATAARAAAPTPVATPAPTSYLTRVGHAAAHELARAAVGAGSFAGANEALHWLSVPTAMALGAGLATAAPRLARGALAVPRSIVRNPLLPSIAELGATNALFPQPNGQ